jgi:hypothetical protein
MTRREGFMNERACGRCEGHGTSYHGCDEGFGPRPCPGCNGTGEAVKTSGCCRSASTAIFHSRTEGDNCSFCGADQ